MKTLPLATCLLMAACAATPPSNTGAEPALRVVARAEQCTPSQAGARLLRDAADVRQATQQPLDGDIDPAREALVLVALGTRPTPGYGISLQAAEAPAHGTLRLPLQYRRPSPDAILPQMLTTPCAVIAVERSPDVRALWVPLIDGGETRLELTTSARARPDARRSGSRNASAASALAASR